MTHVWGQYQRSKCSLKNNLRPVGDWHASFCKTGLSDCNLISSIRHWGLLNGPKSVLFCCYQPSPWSLLQLYVTYHDINLRQLTVQVSRLIQNDQVPGWVDACHITLLQKRPLPWRIDAPNSSNGEWNLRKLGTWRHSKLVCIESEGLIAFYEIKYRKLSAKINIDCL